MKLKRVIAYFICFVLLFILYPMIETKIVEQIGIGFKARVFTAFLFFIALTIVEFVYKLITKRGKDEKTI